MIIGCSIVTWIPRVLPFALAKSVAFPKPVLAFLKFLPISILTALTFQSILEVQANGWIGFKQLETLAALPTLLVAIRTQDLMKTVVTGIAAIALLRLLF
ncbi:hypothetical protein RU97_GL000765 [Enterococcus canis]|uniref:Branched-chain amino acid ABC transporter n=1 Tax=Enterococcus canis TaxID=214095 RepID=A0A1L8RHH5_9ENTE|nr:hypothetical protein RU97_GL000765 [Enterococcus canis]